MLWILMEIIAKPQIRVWTTETGASDLERMGIARRLDQPQRARPRPGRRGRK